MNTKYVLKNKATGEYVVESSGEIAAAVLVNSCIAKWGGNHPRVPVPPTEVSAIGEAGLYVTEKEASSELSAYCALLNKEESNYTVEKVNV